MDKQVNKLFPLLLLDSKYDVDYLPSVQRVSRMVLSLCVCKSLCVCPQLVLTDKEKW